jgi:hypothetical protein
MREQADRDSRRMYYQSRRMAGLLFIYFLFPSPSGRGVGGEGEGNECIRNEILKSLTG